MARADSRWTIPGEPGCSLNTGGAQVRVLQCSVLRSNTVTERDLGGGLVPLPIRSLLYTLILVSGGEQ